MFCKDSGLLPKQELQEALGIDWSWVHLKHENICNTCQFVGCGFGAITSPTVEVQVHSIAETLEIGAYSLRFKMVRL